MSKIREAFFESLESPKYLLRKLWLCRFPIAFASLLVFVGPLGIRTTILANGFLICNIQQMASITAMSLICATVLLKQMALVFRQSQDRYIDTRDPRLDETSHVPQDPRNWTWLQTGLLLVAGLSLPLTCWILSMHEASSEASFSDDPSFTFERGLGGLVLGFVLYFVVYLLSASLHHAMEPENGGKPVLKMPLWESLRHFMSLRFLRIKHLFQVGHFELFIDFVLLFTFYVVYYTCSCGSEMTPEDAFTTPFYLVLGISLLSMALSATSYFLDYYRTPTLVAVLTLLVSSYVFSRIDHRFPVVRIERRPSSEKTVKDMNAIGVVADSARNDAKIKDDYIFIVVAPGGGIHASAWTAQVLAGLHDRYRERFSSRLKLISAVSGGSVGAMFYLDHFPYLENAAVLSSRGDKDQGMQDERFRKYISTTFRRASTSSLEALAWGALFPDTSRLFIGNWIQEDRGMVQERRWLRRMDVGSGYGQTLYSWKREADEGKMPYVVFNATEAETGRRVLFSTFSFQKLGNSLDRSIELHADSIPDEARAIDYLSIANEQFDLPISTAVRLSATFPYAAAAAMPAKDTLPLGHVVDGGYVDNEGLLTALDFIRIDSLKLENSSRRYVIIRILHNPPLEDHLISPTDPGLSESGWEYASFGPLMAMSNVRISSQRERGEIELRLLKDAMQGRDPNAMVTKPSVKAEDPSQESGVFALGSKVISIVIPFTPPSDYQAPPLNWKLSPKQRTAYGTAWKQLTGEIVQRAPSPTESQEQPKKPLGDRADSSTKDEFKGLQWFEDKLRPMNVHK